MQVSSECKNLWNDPSVWLGAVGGFFVWFLGGWDSLIVALVTLMVVDIVTGFLKGIFQRRLSSAIGYKGFMKKVMVLIVVGASVVIQAILPNSLPLREITIMFFVCNEAISVLENAAVMIPIPKRLKDILLQLRDKEDKADKK